MKTLPANLILEKNLLSSSNPWVYLVSITNPGGDVLRFAANTEDVVFGGFNYTAFPFEIEAIKQTSKGQIPSLSLKVSNVSRAIQGDVEALDGLVGQTVTLYFVNTNLLGETYTSTTWTFEIIGCHISDQWVNFTLGMPSPLGRRYPLYRYIPDRCRYVSNFKGVECKYSGGDATCTGTLDDCTDNKSNEANFGGFLGLAKGGIRVA